MGDKGNRQSLEVNPDSKDLQLLNTYDSFAINYVPNFTMESGTPPFDEYNDGAVDTPIDGDGGAVPAGVFQLVTSTDINDKIRGNVSLCLEKAAGSFQGQGFSHTFEIDPIDQGKAIKYEFDFKTTANYADGDIGIFFYDITNSQLIYPSNIDIPASGITVGQTFRGHFQAAIDSTSYRMIIHQRTTSALAYDFCFDHMFIGPYKGFSNSPGFMSDGESYPLTGNFTTNVTYTCRVERMGRNAKIQFQAFFSGATDAGAFAFNMPTGLAVDEDELIAITSANDYVTGRGELHDSDLLTVYPVNGRYSKLGNQVVPVSYNSQLTDARYAGFVNGGQFTIGANDNISLTVTLPIKGWGVGTKPNEIISGRLHGVEAIGNAGEVIAGGTTNIPFNTTLTDESGAWNGSEFTCQETGFHDFEGASFFTDSIGRAIDAFIDTGSGYVFWRRGSTLTTDDSINSFSFSGKLNQGDKVALRIGGTPGTLSTSNANAHSICITKESSLNSQLVPDDLKITGKYQSTSGQLLTVALSNTVIFNAFVYDNFATYDNITGIGTVHKKCRLGIYALITVVPQANWVLFGRYLLQVIRNGVDLLVDDDQRVEEGGDINFRTFKVYIEADFVPGDTFELSVFPTNNTGNMTALARGNYITFSEVE